MIRKILKESVIVIAGTLFFLALCASVGISARTRSTPPIVTADEQKLDSGNYVAMQPGLWSGNHPVDSAK